MDVLQSDNNPFGLIHSDTEFGFDDDAFGVSQSDSGAAQQQKKKDIPASTATKDKDIPPVFGFIFLSIILSPVAMLLVWVAGLSTITWWLVVFLLIVWTGVLGICLISSFNDKKCDRNARVVFSSFTCVGMVTTIWLVYPYLPYLLSPVVVSEEPPVTVSPIVVSPAVDSKESPVVDNKASMQQIITLLEPDGYQQNSIDVNSPLAKLALSRKDLEDKLGTASKIRENRKERLRRSRIAMFTAINKVNQSESDVRKQFESGKTFGKTDTLGEAFMQWKNAQTDAAAVLRIESWMSKQEKISPIWKTNTQIRELIYRLEENGILRDVLTSLYYLDKTEKDRIRVRRIGMSFLFFRRAAALQASAARKETYLHKL